MHLFAPGAAEPAHTFRFPRQRVGGFLCLSDYVLPPQNGKRDHVALFVVTAGEGVRERSEKAKNEGYYFKSHGMQALGDRIGGSLRGMVAQTDPRRLGFP